MIRPTLRTALALAALVPVALLIAVSAPNLWVVVVLLPACLVSLAALDALGMARPADLAPTIVTPDPLHIGTTGRARLRVRRPRLRGLTHLEVKLDAGPELEPPPVATVGTPVADEVEIGFPLRPLRRGTARIVRAWFRWRSRLGLAQRAWTLPLDRDVPIIPDIRADRASQLELLMQEALFGAKRQRQSGDGSEFSALRDYVPGLDRRAIDWKQSARHVKLLCKEFQTERNHAIVLAYDTGHLMSEPLDGIPKLDHAINAGLMLCWLALRAGDRVGLFAFDSRLRLAVTPMGGTHAFPLLQRRTAEIEYRQDETNFTLGLAEISLRLDRRALLVIFTDFVDTVTAELLIDNVARIAKRHLPLFVSLEDPLLGETTAAPPRSFTDLTRAVVAEELARDRAIVFNRLRRLGVQCLETTPARFGVDLLNRYIAIKSRELIG